ncbi:MAG: alpha/beta fold hydrolase [Rhodobacteraceae bacterium]|nr:alpha/beta fold hydrolase [Paracoccaceae bacterium]
MALPRIPSDWPGAAASRGVRSGGIAWHVQECGSGPTVMLIHGAGASTHTWRHIAPALALDFTVLAVDLPGQGFTTLPDPSAASLAGMTAALVRLLADMGRVPAALVGHSAGAAIALNLAPELPAPPRAIVAINPSLGSFEGIAGWLYPVAARLLALNPLVPGAFARIFGTERRVEGLIASTGSRLDAGGLALYRRLVADRTHVAGTLAMMARWTLGPLLDRLPAIAVPTLFILGEGDRAVPPAQAEAQARRMPDATVVRMPGSGHLVHEEAAPAVLDVMLPFLKAHAGRPPAG